MSNRSINVLDLETMKPNHVIEVKVSYWDGGRKRYVLNMHAVEINPPFRSTMIDFAVKSTIELETVGRFNAKRLSEHATNWKNAQGVKELIEEICKGRGLELTAEAKAIVGIEV